MWHGQGSEPTPRRGADESRAAAPPSLADFTAALIHEMRTPLSALSAEVEIALRRDRSPAAYREALTRIAEQVTELVHLTRDFSVLAHAAGSHPLPSTADLRQLLSQLAMHYDAGLVQIAVPPSAIDVAGDDPLLTRALRVLVDHAVRGRAPSSVVRLQASPACDATHDTVTLTLDAAAPGLSPDAWQALTDVAQTAAISADRPGLMRIYTAASIVRLAGGHLAVDRTEGAMHLRIVLRRAPPERAHPTSEQSA